MKKNHSRQICVVGLGYVGLPVLTAFGKLAPVVGIDINQERVNNLKAGIDITHEVDRCDLISDYITYTSAPDAIANCNFYIVTVPTPVDQSKRPDLSCLRSASAMIGKVLKKGDIVVYESTVYPGATEEDCLPVLEEHSGLKCGVDFGLGYSPERINPGDKNHTFTKIKKIVSASNEDTLNIVDEVYSSVVEAGTFRAATIKVAEAAKIIENIQRDLNISLMNELSLIFDKMDIDTHSVIQAASSKWNFHPYTPGLVGGHCIGVDPYYLTFKAESLGHIPDIILSGRRVNENMGKHISEKAIKKMVLSGIEVITSTITIMGITFKENCPDIRNTRVVDIVQELKGYSPLVQVYDPHADTDEVFHEYGIRLTPRSDLRPADCLVLAVAHDEFIKFTLNDYQKLCKPKAVIIDVKAISPVQLLEKSGHQIWRL